MRFRLCRLLMSVSCVAILAGCQELARNETGAWDRLEARGFQRLELDAEAFSLTAALRDEDPSRVLHVYIEGDGRAWITRRRPSSDPTPLDPVAAELAALDPTPAVLYLARPCQWRPETAAGKCAPELWTSHRYSEQVVDAYVQLIRRVATARQSSHVALLGHSGGGALATLVASRLDEVDWLLTVASNLDTGEWTSHHHVSPLSGSLNPADYAARLRALPQRHLVGSSDEVVPVNVVRAYTLRGGIDPDSIQVVAGADHHCCWAARWPELLGAFEHSVGAETHQASAGVGRKDSDWSSLQPVADLPPRT